jgi:hypothetical protein
MNHYKNHIFFQCLNIVPFQSLTYVHVYNIYKSEVYTYNSHIWISQDVVDEDKFLCEFKQRVIDCFVSQAVAFFEDSPKCNFY